MSKASNTPSVPPAPPICGIVIYSSWHDPVACAFKPGHEGNHSWASIPQFAPTHRLAGISDERAAEMLESQP